MENSDENTQLAAEANPAQQSAQQAAQQAANAKPTKAVNRAEPRQLGPAPTTREVMTGKIAEVLVQHHVQHSAVIAADIFDAITSRA